MKEVIMPKKITNEVLFKLFEDKEFLFEFMLSNFNDKEFVTEDTDPEILQKIKALNTFQKKMQLIFKEETKSSFNDINTLISERELREDEYPKVEKVKSDQDASDKKSEEETTEEETGTLNL